MPPSRVVVNRKVPATQPVTSFPVFSTEPTDQEITRARVFGEPLVPVGGTTGTAENLSLANALGSYLRRQDPEDTTPLVEFLESHPGSSWRASLLTNVGSVYRRSGRLSKALAVWEQAWRLSREESDERGRAVGDRAVSELAALNAGLGRCGRLEALVAEIDGRDVRGPSHERIAAARQGLWLMRNRPEDAFRCGPLALERILAHEHRGPNRDTRLLQPAGSLPLGTSLPQLESLARALGLKMRMAKRMPGSVVIAPAVVHWSLGPFAAVLTEEKGRYLVQDPSFGEETWVTRKTLDEEASGYFLVPEGPLPEGWRAVERAEGESIWYPDPSVFKVTSRSYPSPFQRPPATAAIDERSFDTRPSSAQGCEASPSPGRLDGAQEGPSPC